jgi:xanthine dehydrogenase accessory factor
VFDFDLEGRAVAASQPICGGRMRVLIDPTAAQHRAAYAAAATARERRQRGVLVTFVETPSAGIPTVENTPETAAIRVTVEFHAVVPVAPTDPLLEVFVEPILPAPLVVVVGGGHVGQAVAVQADLVGFDILVIDDRAEFTGHELFPPGTTTRCGPIAAEVAALPLAADTYVVIVTRGHEQDAEALAACIHKPAAYLGMIGSRRKVAMMREAFIASGQATAAEFDRVHAPIGLGIGAWTVPEIAVSIVAELIAERRSQGPYWERNTSCGVRWKLVQ